MTTPPESRYTLIKSFVLDFLSKYCCCCCRRYCSCFLQQKIFPSETNGDDTDDQELSISKTERDNTVPNQVIIKKFVQKWEKNFWKKIWIEHRENLFKREAATKIQAIIRGYLARKYYERLLQRAIFDMNEFWRRKRELKLLEKEKQRIAQLVRQRMSSEIARNTLIKCVTKKARRDGALTIQRAWRGMIGRCIANYFFMLAKQLRVNKPKPPPSRFKVEVFRRIWARKKFTPTGGWPGKADFKEFDMWDHVYTPPKGNKYGLKTHKVRHILDEKEKNLLLNDKNAWIGMPIGLKEEKEKPSSSSSSSFSSKVAYRLQSSPYQAPVVQHDTTINKPKRPTGLRLLDSLGWKNPLIEQKKEQKKVENLSTSGVFPTRRGDVENQESPSPGPRPGTRPGTGNGSGSGSVMNPPSPSATNRPYSPQRSWKNNSITSSSSPGPGPVSDQIKTKQKLNPRSVAEERFKIASLSLEKEQKKLQQQQSFVSSSLELTSSKKFTSSDHPDLPLQNSLATFSYNDSQEMNFFHTSQNKSLTVTNQVSVASLRGTMKPSMGHPITLGQTTKQLTDKGVSIQQLAKEKEKELFTLTHPSSTNKKISTDTHTNLPTTNTSTSWNEMKTSFLNSNSYQISNKKRNNNLQNRKRPWPVPISEHYQMEYSWLSQPLVTEAAKQIYFEETEKEQKNVLEQRSVEVEKLKKEKKFKMTLLNKVKKYNSQEVSEVRTLNDLKEYEIKVNNKIKEERLNSKPIKHPYDWSVGNVSNSIMS